MSSISHKPQHSPSPEGEGRGEVHTGKPLIIWVLLFALALTWGSSFILMKKGLEVFTPQQVAALRIFIGGLALLPLAYRVQRTEWQGGRLKYILLVVTVGSVIPALLFTVAETRISSSLAGIFNCLTPLFTMLLAYLLYRTRIRAVQAAGLAVGFIGAACMIALQPADPTAATDSRYALLVVLATILYALSASTIKAKLQGVSSLSIAILGLGMVAPLAGLYLWHSGLFAQLASSPQARYAMVYMLLLGILGTGYGNFVYYYLIQRTGPVFASIVTYLMPIVAVGWGVLANEPLGLTHLLGMALILLGIWLTSK